MTSCLVIDDSSVVRKVVRRILEGYDIDVEEAGDGAEAVRRCQVVMPMTMVFRMFPMPSSCSTGFSWMDPAPGFPFQIPVKISQMTAWIALKGSNPTF